MSHTIQDPSQPGHFRIGFVSLAIPPEDLSVNRVTNSDEVMPLRSKFSQHIKTGHSRWDVTIRWKALLGSDPSDPHFWDQWEDVRSILAMFKAAPFVEVENDEVRRILTDEDPAMQSQRMGFALRQFMISSSMDIVDGLDCSLTMSLFNYLPYSKDFGYQGTIAGQSTDATQLSCPAFYNYISGWKAENLDKPLNRTSAADEDYPSPWKEQDPQATALAWRKYYVHNGAPNSVGPAPLAASHTPSLTSNDTSLWAQSPPSDLSDQTNGLDTEDGPLYLLPVDHWTSRGTNDFVTFRYARREIDLLNGDGTMDSTENNLFVQQISVVFVNQFAILPLASYQYPTLQHVGPAGTMVSLSMVQKGYESSGIPTISNMLSALENQFLQMRTEWRSVASVHRMQAVFVTNQILNMLGIFGLKNTELTCENVKDSSDLIQAQFVGSQYENVFEQLDPFMVKGPLAGYQDAYSAALNSDAFKNLDQGTQNALRPLVDFQNARNNLDESWLTNYFNQNPGIPARITNMCPLGTTLNQFQTAALNKIAQRAMVSFPYLQDRISNPSSYSYVDFFILTRTTGNGHYAGGTPDLSSSELDIIKNMVSQVETTPASPSMWGQSDGSLTASHETTTPTDSTKRQQLIGSIYDAVFTTRISADSSGKPNDPAFQGSLDKMLNNPAINQAFQNAVNIKGPGSDNNNADHGAYADMGFRGAMADASYHPASYFVDYSQQFLQDTAAKLETTMPNMLSAYQQLNQSSNPSAVPAYQTELGVSDNNTYGVLARSSLPLYSMKAAFPTYKLFLMEEDNLHVYYAFDDFYTYSSVIEIEVERHKDRGDTAVIQLTNLASLLSHKLYDSSTLGKLEHKFNNWQPEQGMSSDGSTTTTPGGVSTAVNATSWFGRNLQEGIDTNGRPKLVPLKYFALQTGTKIQIRMGYAHNPDELCPVFQGVVTEIIPGEVMQIVAQGFQIELEKPAPDEIKQDSYWPIGIIGQKVHDLSDIVTELFQLRLPSAWTALTDLVANWKSPAFGGLRAWGDAGDAGSVVAALLKASAARHFGHWQVGNTTDPYLKGFTWSALVGSWLDANSVVGGLLSSAYDRREENILINHLVNYDGSHNDGTFKRSYMFENPGMFNILPPEYHIPNAAEVTPWMVMKDVARRYPDFILAVKNYGFPFAADATLVFGHPLDWYYSRMPMIGEKVQQPQITQNDSPNFLRWWNQAGGKQKFMEAWSQYVNSADTVPDTLDGSSIPVFGDDSLSAAQMAAQIEANPDQFESIIDRVINNINLNGVTILSGVTGLLSSNVRNAKNAFLNLLNDARQVVGALRNPGSSLKVDYSARVKPVRRYHFVDEQSIISNGIVLNEKFNNAVIVNGHLNHLNSMIPPHHTRIVNCDAQIIDVAHNMTDVIETCYAQSFLKEEAGRMYRGELVLRLIPEIEPYDVVMISDPSTGIVGPIEVESVIHTFNQELGAISVVRPRAMVLVNEAASVTMLGGLWQAMTTASASAKGFKTEFEAMSGLSQTTASVSIELLSAAALGTLLIFSPISPLAAIGLAAFGLMFAASIQNNRNPMFVAPLSRFGKPWVGGLEGYRVCDISAWATGTWDRFMTEEIAPTIESYRLVQKGLNPFADQPQHAQAAPAQSTSSTPAPPGSARGENFINLWAQAIKQHEGWIPPSSQHPNGSRSYRDNNPGNLKVTGDLGRDDQGFGKFSMADKGMDALKNDLRAKCRLYPTWSIAQAMSKYAPPSENNTQAYVASIEKAIGVPATTSIGSLFTSS